jgi:hypothetical protein
MIEFARFAFAFCYQFLAKVSYPKKAPDAYHTKVFVDSLLTLSEQFRPVPLPKGVRREAQRKPASESTIEGTKSVHEMVLNQWKFPGEMTLSSMVSSVEDLSRDRRCLSGLGRGVQMVVPVVEQNKGPPRYQSSLAAWGVMGFGRPHP